MHIASRIQRVVYTFINHENGTVKTVSYYDRPENALAA